jgi:hypothetical protein
MRDSNDGHRHDRVFDRVDHAIVPLADSILVLAREFLGAVRPGIVREREDPAHDEAADLLGKAFDLLLGRPPDEDAIGGHDV